MTEMLNHYEKLERDLCDFGEKVVIWNILITSL